VNPVRSVLLIAVLAGVAGVESAAGQARGSLQVAAVLVSVAPSQTALGLVRQALKEPSGFPVNSSLARIGLPTPFPSATARQARLVRIDFLRN